MSVLFYSVLFEEFKKKREKNKKYDTILLLSFFGENVNMYEELTEQSGALYEELDELQLEQCTAGIFGILGGIVSGAVADTVVEKVSGKSLTDWTGLAVGSVYDYFFDASFRRMANLKLGSFLETDLGIDL